MAYRHYSVLLICVMIATSVQSQIIQFSSSPDSNHALGKQFLNKGEFMIALEYFTEAEKQFSQEGTTDKLANEWNSIAVIYNIIEDFPTAFRYYAKALDYYRESGNREMQGVVMSNLGNIYFKTGDFAKARKHYKESVKFFNPPVDAHDLAVTFGSISNSYSLENNHDSALFYNRMAAAMNKTDPDSAFAGRLLINNSAVLRRMGQYDKAIRYLDSALVIFDLMKAPMFKGEVFLEKSKIMAEAGKQQEALPVALTAQRMLEETGMLAPLTDCYDVISMLYADAGDFKNAYLYTGKFRIYNDSLVKVNSRQELLGLETRYQLKLKEEELVLVNKSNEKYRIFTLVLIVLTGIILIVSVVLVLKRRKLALAYSKLAEKQKEISKLSSEEMPAPVPSIPPVKTADTMLESRLDDLMKNEKVYRLEGLTLEQLAKMADTNRTELSEHINSFHGRHFNNYLNSFRVNEVVKELIGGAHKQVTLEALARKAGFSNRTSFNEAFRKETGLTPRYFIQNLEP